MKPKLKLHQVRVLLLGLSLILLGAGFGFWWGTHQVQLSRQKPFTVKIERSLPADKSEVDFSLFWEVWDRLAQSFLDKGNLNPQTMVWGAIRGLVASLDDPYTVFLPPEENKQVKEDLNGSFEGVGIELGYQDGSLSVIAPLKGMPAEKAGVKAGDLILKIEEEETLGMTLPRAVELIRGPQGSTIKMTLLHLGESDAYEVAIVRATILIPSVELSWVDDWAHLKLMRFGDRTNDEWHQAVTQITNHQVPVTGLILDLRNNPGGYLNGAVFIVSEFLEEGVVVQQEMANGSRETYSVNRLGRLTDIPLVVLVNRGSASASEIVAGALQDHQRAWVVGEKTFGKGSIQEAQELKGGSGLHVTTARWLLPSGESIDQAGVTPDFEAVDDLATEAVDEALEKAREIL